MASSNMKLDEVHLRGMNKEDLDYVVSIHLEAFCSFFLSFLGSRFLHVLYSFIQSDSKSISIVAERIHDNRIVGFVVGTLEPPSFYRRAIRSRVLSFALSTIPALLKDPRILGRLVRAFTKPKEMDAIQADCELMSIAVLPDYASKGIGRKLEAAFTDEARRHNAHSITLTTDKLNNDVVNRFYESCGYVVYDSFVTPEGREMNRYMKKI